MTTPQDTPPLQGAGERELVNPGDLRKIAEYLNELTYHWTEEHVLLDAAKELESLRAQRQAWEEEESEHSAYIDEIRSSLGNDDSLSLAESAEFIGQAARAAGWDEHEAPLHAWIEDRAKALASLREETANLKTNVRRLHAMTVDSVLQEDEAKQESAALRARVEELEGVAAVARQLYMANPNQFDWKLHDVTPFRQVVGAHIESIKSGAALSSLGEQESGEVRGE